MNLFSFLSASARRYGPEGAVFQGNQRLSTYAELHSRALRLAGALQSMGRSGDRVLIASGNCVQYPEILFAIWAAGMVAVPVNAKLHTREILQIAEDSGAGWIFSSLQLVPALDEASCRIIPIGSEIYGDMASHDPGNCVDCQADDLAWLFFTSGTTGRAKGAMLSHRNLTAMSVAHVGDLECIEAHHSIIHAAPMSHGSGLLLLPYTMRGARHVIPESGGFDPKEFLGLAATHHEAGAFLAPTMVRRLRLYMSDTCCSAHRLRSLVYGGGPMYLDELKRSLEALGPILIQLYGQGESPMTITGLRREDHIGASDEILRSVGWPRSGVEVRVVDEKERDLPVGVVGEIICRSDVVMRGYWNNAQANAETLRSGWLYTGDLGSLNESGMLTLGDRSKDVIISGGSNIYPREVEEVLLAHPQVAEACVVGIRDDDWGEAVAAVVVREAGSTITPAELEAQCLACIARFKRPRHYAFVGFLPKNAYGKVAKRDVLAMLATQALLNPI